MYLYKSKYLAESMRIQYRVMRRICRETGARDERPPQVLMSAKVRVALHQVFGC